MNLVRIKIKEKEEIGYYKSSHRKYNFKVKAENMSKEQVERLSVAIRRACISILPDKEVRANV